MKVHHNPDGVHTPVAGYSHQIQVTNIDKLLFFSGQIGMDEYGNIPDDPVEQYSLALDNVLKNLRAAGLGLTDLTKLTFYLVEPMDADRRRAILHEKLGDYQPCMTLIYVAALANPVLKVEIDAFAAQDH